jgi:hypothetical protein
MFTNSLGFAGVQIFGKGIWGAMVRNPTMAIAAIGAGYGAISSNTSILGGAVKGAGLATVGRYGMGALRGINSRYLGSMGMFGAGDRIGGLSNLLGGAGLRMRRMVGVDYGRTRQLANTGFNKIRGLW